MQLNFEVEHTMKMTLKIARFLLKKTSACLRGALHTGPTEAREPASLSMIRDQMNIPPLEAPDMWTIPTGLMSMMLLILVSGPMPLMILRCPSIPRECYAHVLTINLAVQIVEMHTFLRFLKIATSEETIVTNLQQDKFIY